MSEIRIEPGANAKARKVIGRGLRAYNKPFLGPSREKPLVVTLRDDPGEIKGGAVGHIRLGWCYIDLIWLDETERGQGQGSALLAAVEDEARKRGATNIHLSSWTFQAPDFYQKHGYREFGRLEGYPKGHDSVFLTKVL